LLVTADDAMTMLCVTFRKAVLNFKLALFPERQENGKTVIVHAIILRLNGTLARRLAKRHVHYVRGS
jgi:hypothetical protein